MVFLVGAIVGATAGAQDLDTGVFRDLAATGRSRTALFLSRVGGAWVVVGAITRCSRSRSTSPARSLLADGTPTPARGRHRRGRRDGARLGRGSARRWRSASPRSVGSRGPVIAILLAVHLIFEPQLQGAGFLGDARQALPISAINRIGDQASGLDYTLGARHRDRRRPRLDRRRAGRRRMAHQDARDLVAAPGPGIRSARVSGPSVVAAHAVDADGRRAGRARSSSCWSCPARSPRRDEDGRACSRRRDRARRRAAAAVAAALAVRHARP